MADATLSNAGKPRLVLDRWAVLKGLTLLALCALLAAAVLRVLGEEAGTNSYVLLAESWLHGRVDLPACWDVDCAVFEGRFYNIFPPMPAIILTPFVAAFGTGFAGTLIIAFALYLASVALWWRLFAKLGRTADEIFWLTAAVAAGSPLYIVLAGADTVWFFAQVCGFFFVSLALHEALAGRLALAGAAVGAAFLCRQMSIFYAPFVLLLATPAATPWHRIDRDTLMRVLRIGWPIAIAILVYLAYNAVRFGDPMNTGYAYMMEADDTIGLRIQNYGLFNPAYFVFNLLYMVYQGFHVEFTQPMLLDMGGMDRAGSSLLAASPWILLLFFIKPNRIVWIGGLIAAMILGSTLFYHSNGFVQYGVQRYTLDWLPFVFVALAVGLSAVDFRFFRLLAAVSVGMTAVTALLLAIVVA